MGAIRKGQTSGNANSIFGVKWYPKPSLGKVVGRKPGVLRRSDKVLDRNREIRADPPAPDAHAACLKEHPEVGDVCPIELFRTYLAAEMS